MDTRCTTSTTSNTIEGGLGIDDDDLLALVTASLWQQQRPTRCHPRLMHMSMLSGRMKVWELLNGHERPLYSKVRMTRIQFLALSQILEEHTLLRSSPELSIDEKLMIFLHIVCHAISNREAQDHWQHSGETISRCFAEVLEAICSLRYRFVIAPNYNKTPKLIRDNREKYSNYFNSCVGAIDGTHVPCVPPSSEQAKYRNRKGILSFNILAACSFDMRFTYMLSGWEGSAHDSRVLQDAIQNHGFPIPPEGRYYLADSGYATRSYILTPYRRTTYHLQEYMKRGMGFKTAEEYFNFKHSSLRNCIERTFGVWKARFKILQRMSSYLIEKQAQIPIACAVVHNFINICTEKEDMADELGGEDDSLINHFNNDAVPVSVLQQGNTEFDDDGHDDIDEILGDHASVDERRGGEMMQKYRDALAQRMWEDRRRRRMPQWT